MMLIEGDTIEETYKEAVKTIITTGNHHLDERRKETLEILNLITHIDKPYSKNQYNTPTVQGQGFWTGRRIKDYIEQFISIENPGFTYTYGNRLREHFDGIDQLEQVIKRLKNHKGTRRATMITYDPQIDFFSEEIPCMIMIDFKIRNNTLHTTGVWRSHDIGRAWYPNLLALSYLSQMVMYETKTDPGPITIHSVSAHIYKDDIGDLI